MNFFESVIDDWFLMLTYLCNFRFFDGNFKLVLYSYNLKILYIKAFVWWISLIINCALKPVCIEVKEISYSFKYFKCIWRGKQHLWQTIHSKSLTESAILPDYKHFRMLFIDLMPCQTMTKSHFQSEFSCQKSSESFWFFFLNAE